VKELEHIPERFTFASNEHQLLNADGRDGPSTEQFHEKRQRCGELQSLACFCMFFELAF